MTIPDFIMLTAACAPAPYFTTLSTVVMQESWNNTCAISVRDELLHQPLTFGKNIATTEQLKQSGYDSGISLEQIGIQNLKWFHVSRSNMYNSCKDLKALQTALTGRYKQTISKENSERTILRAALSFYNPKRFENDFIGTSVRKVGFHVAMEAPALSGGESQEPIQLHTEEPNQIIKTETLPPSSEELVDAFAHKISGAHDVFTAEDASSLEKQQE
ncbi:TrwN protein [Bartonella vinsonii]|uniref:Type IV secretion system lytic transglycosylase VirB1 n=1 Tax=Bartonella vinsonii TaxID=33047 RepID=A0A3S4YFD5_BARVI|nr:TrwN protein [Bartonella vinsonii]VEJ44495.1 type IV secretion system lytic transglycosylase VirB1 [Bartonella vinsonii]